MLLISGDHFGESPTKKEVLFQLQTVLFQRTITDDVQYYTN